MDVHYEYVRAQQINKVVTDWAKDFTKNKLPAGIEKLGVSDTTQLLKSVKYRARKTDGLISRLTISFAKQGLFAIYGVGKGVPRAKVKSSNRKVRDWYNPTADDEVSKLADKLAELEADLFVKSMKI